MNYTFDQYRQSADALLAKLGDFRPKVALVLGSGLGYLGDLVENPIAVPYTAIPHFKTSTAPGHKGQLVFGTLAMGLVMVPANHFITPVWMGAPTEVVDSLMLVGILPFNLLKAGINSAVTFVVYKVVSRYLVHGGPFGAIADKSSADASGT